MIINRLKALRGINLAFLSTFYTIPVIIRFRMLDIRISRHKLLTPPTHTIQSKSKHFFVTVILEVANIFFLCFVTYLSIYLFVLRRQSIKWIDNHFYLSTWRQKGRSRWFEEIRAERCLYIYNSKERRIYIYIYIIYIYIYIYILYIYI